MSRTFGLSVLCLAASLGVAAPALSDGGTLPAASSTYVGARLGYGWVDPAARAGTVNEEGYDADGALVGLVFGHDYASSGPWIFGAVVDVSTGNERGSIEFGGPVIFKVKQEWEASLRGKAGYRMEGFTPYATAGVTYGSFQTKYSQVGLPFLVADSQAFGWTIGAGVDVPIDERWTAVAEYRYTDYGDGIDASNAVDGPYDISSGQLYLGVNYRF